MSFMELSDAAKSASGVTSVAPVTNEDFPMYALSEAAGDMAIEVAAVAGIAEVFPACLELAIVGAALGRGVVIPSGLGRKSFGNIYVIPAANSGEGKSDCFRPLMEPVEDFQKSVQQNAQLLKKKLKVRLQQIKALLKMADKGLYPGTDDELGNVLEEKDRIEVDLKRRVKIILEDATPQAAQVALADNDERILSASIEGRVPIRALFHDKGDSVYLKGWSGDRSDVDRISRESVTLRAPRVTILWCPQHDLFHEMFAKRVLTENGFLPRVLPWLVEYNPTESKAHVRGVRSKTQQRWNTLVRGLFETYHANVGEPLELKCVPTVLELITSYHNEQLRRIGRGELSVLKVREYVLRWAEQAWRLCLILHGMEHGREAHTKTVQEYTADNAVQLMKVFSRQQLELLDRARAHERTEMEAVILNTVLAKGEATARDLLRGPLRYLSVSDVGPALEKLVATGKLECRDKPTDGGGYTARYYFLPSAPRQS